MGGPAVAASLVLQTSLLRYTRKCKRAMSHRRVVAFGPLAPDQSRSRLPFGRQAGNAHAKHRQAEPGPANCVRVRVWLGHQCIHDRSFEDAAHVSLGPSGTFALHHDRDQHRAGTDLALLVPVAGGFGLHLGTPDHGAEGWLTLPGMAPWSLTELRADARLLMRLPIVPLRTGMMAELRVGLWRLELSAVCRSARLAASAPVPKPLGSHRLGSRKAQTVLAVGCLVAALVGFLPAPQTPSVVARAKRLRTNAAASALASVTADVRSPQAQYGTGSAAAIAAVQERVPVDAMVLSGQPASVASRPLRNAIPAEAVVLEVQPAAVLGDRPGSVLATGLPIWREWTAEPTEPAQEP